MNENAKALVIASLAADSLALGPHWIYDTNTIDQAFGQITTLQSPLEDSYHKNRTKGQFTHYGDQTLLLLRSIVDNNGFEIEQFAADWQKQMASYDGYVDGATTKTLENIQTDQPMPYGSPSGDLGGAARIAPLIYRYHDDEALLLSHVRAQTALTHNNKSVLTGAETLAKITCKVLAGKSPTTAVEECLEEGVADLDLDMKIRVALATAGKNTRETIAGFGMACNISMALPGVIHLIVSYEKNLKTALIENVMAGGDSAARGLATGMILGAHNSLDTLPQEWLSEMQEYEKVIELLNQEQ